MDSTSREDFLGTVREALGGEASEAQPTRRQRPQAQDRPELPAPGRDEILQRLVQHAEAAGWRVARCGSAEEAQRYVAGVIREKGVQRVVASADPVLGQLDLPTLVKDLGGSLTVMTLEQGNPVSQDPALRREELRARAFEAELGITGVRCAVAETGSCAVEAGQHVSRLASLAPPAHIAVVEEDQVVESLDDLFGLLRDAWGSAQGTMPSNLTLITGPSRTGDIEQELVVGVHGPGETHLLLVSAPPR